jgi:hypothetical protein
VGRSMDHFDEPIYIATNEPLKEAYFRTIAADVLLNDSENLEKRFGQGALRELDPAISLASALMVRTEGWELAVSFERLPRFCAGRDQKR